MTLVSNDLIFDHVGILTDDVDSGARRLADTFGVQGFTQRFDDEGLGVSVRFVRDASGMVYELIAPFGPSSPVARTLRSNSNLLDQVAYIAPSLAPAARTLRALGNRPLSVPKPALAFGGAEVQFFLSNLGFVIELIEQSNHRHSFSPEL